MPSTKTSQRLNRLEELTGLLKSSDHQTIDDLAIKLNVSRRTLVRDLDVLKERGFPIETDQGRGGGVRLHRHWGVGRLNLNYAEVIDLLLSMAVMEKLGSPIFLQNLKSIRMKISMSFPQQQRQQIQLIRQRILVGDLASNSVWNNLTSPKVGTAEVIYEAFFETKTLNITYAANKGRSKRTIEPHYILVTWPAWYILAWDYMRHDIRCFRLDRLIDASLNNDQFKLKPPDKFQESISNIASAL